MDLSKVNIWIDAILTDNKSKLSGLSQSRLELLKNEVNKSNSGGNAGYASPASSGVQNGGLHIGDMVEVSSTAECYADWKGFKAEVVGIVKRPNGDLDYTLRDGECEYDGFNETDLIKV